ncbi:uncharacterized protein isoform X2 [Leptinotarsa decemlineata]|uniref:uncharacterized protein isoform X2 n=1 Tax=Leptinotarsa decemlineata TaxID=7539 RepID=UPI003D30436F
MSQRTLKILSLAANDKENQLETSVEVSEDKTWQNSNESMDEFDPVTNWVLEIDPKILKEQFLNTQDVKNSKKSKKKQWSSENISSDKERKYEYENINENISSDKERKYEESRVNSSKSTTEVMRNSVNTVNNENNDQMLIFKSRDQNEFGQKSQPLENIDKKHLYVSTDIHSEHKKNQRPNNESVKNITQTENNFQFPVIVVPPKEDVANIGHEISDLPIIFDNEGYSTVNKNYLFVSEVTENYLYCSDEHNNDFHYYSDCNEKESNTMITLPNDDTKICETSVMHSSNITSELPKYAPFTKKINVLSQHILKPSGIENVAFATKTNSNNDGINVLTKSDNHWKVIIPATPTNSDTHLGVRCFRKEEPFDYGSEDNQNATNHSHYSGYIEIEKFHDPIESNVINEIPVSENSFEILEKTSEQSLKSAVSEVNHKSTHKHTDDCEEGVERTDMKHYKDKMTFCFFCDKDVSHFSRHLRTWHQNEIEVQRLHSYKSNSKERRQALSVLGKRGNYVKNRFTLQLRPVRRVKSGILLCSSEFLPCPHCLGFYKKKSLYRHTKNCDSRPISAQGKRQSSQSEGQTALLLGKFKHDELLDKDLFPRMRADEVSLTVKKDPLICKFAYSYLKGRKSKGNLDFVRTSVRNLAKLLQISKDSDSNIKGLIDLLRPKFLTKIIEGVNIIGKYNKGIDEYESPTVAMNFGTLLKKCCDLAIIQLLQESNTEALRKEIKVLKTLIESQWANEVSAQATSNLNSRKWNKEELLPLTSDLKKLKEYLETSSQNSFEQLKRNEKDELAYNSLKELLYCQIILMNRRRPAEVAQIKVETYKSINLNVQETEFEECLTESEKILLNSCSRIVIRGKRGRGVPVLLSQSMKNQFDFFIRVRSNFIENNDYIFHTTGKNFLDGTKVLYKHAKKCGSQNPKSISATRLRKHLATVTQLLQFSDSDLEQLSKFMGHTLQTHCNFYRLSDNTYQTAKLSKLLLLASEGGLEKYKGLDLNHIDIDLNPIFENCEVEEMITEQIPSNTQSTPNDEVKQNSNLYYQKKAKWTSIKQTWSLEQKKNYRKIFC